MHTQAQDAASRYIAFLRAINVGGRTVKMDELRALFEGMGFHAVETFIASGNVIFTTAATPRSVLAQRIETVLAQRIETVLATALGFEVDTFLRTDVEVTAIARYTPFPAAVMAAAGALNVALLAESLTAEETQRVLSLRTAIDDFHVDGREVYWICQTKQSESTFSNTLLERALGKRATFRGLNTIRKLAAKYPPDRTPDPAAT